MFTDDKSDIMRRSTLHIIETDDNQMNRDMNKSYYRQFGVKLSILNCLTSKYQDNVTCTAAAAAITNPKYAT
jgi:hypothetical protein